MYYYQIYPTRKLIWFIAVIFEFCYNPYLPNYCEKVLLKLQNDSDNKLDIVINNALGDGINKYLSWTWLN
jgi:hypothetical protein